ncbi:MAG: glutamine--tRNA ligase/YqeY domain fusion protein [Xanthomonadales bacterium]|nr:glutamine--tRNA ligase/YqeY domain fusion protein [Gammaproteobacteria bacterium]MBT8055100.1 glutamine--tRNA ligase/YqeY domain fusion protein [Gammaproteobacteria bacterium]NND58411.1 glutamine--tRNA ligase/YqeY domain fusion protein [Xanthomonadales bacterium]NNK51694.1 glutamine--tRNA ligase/YqeY domain fusion protein [Xanthomonadales bacterium]
MSSDSASTPTNFIRNIIIKDLETGKHDEIVTRFPPEPNGHLHIGHAKSICLNFGVAAEFGGRTNLRFDDTNPLKENEDFMLAIMEDVRWLGFEWDGLFHASDYFQQLYEFALHLIKTGKAYVEELSAEEIRAHRGTLTEPGRNSPYRDRPVDENLDLFKRMKAGEFEDGTLALRAKIDMASPNINMRDPVVYRIRNASHHRTGDEWHIYPMYDWAHGISDAIEGITHSLCTLEFEDHRPLYDWFLENIPAPSYPRQIEFSRGNLDYTVMSKRRLRELVEEKRVSGWDDPRMPTLAGLRRRGFTPEAIRAFWTEMGISKADSIISMGVLENAVRNDLNVRAPRTMAVLNPLKVVLTNFPEGETVWLDAPVHPQNDDMGTREVALTREIWIERDDFMEDPPRKFFRLKPGGEVRLRNAFIVQCDEVIKDDQGEVVELHCKFDPDTRSGMPGASRKVKGTIHWVSAVHGVPVEVRLCDRLFTTPNPLGDKEQDYREFLNPHSLDVIEDVIVEPAVAAGVAGDFYQFERTGYFCHDNVDSRPGRPVLNRIVTLRDSWARIEKELAQKKS